MTEPLAHPLPQASNTDTPWRADLPRWRQLVPVRWLHALLVGRAVAAAPAGDWCLFEVGEGPWRHEQAPTIPGACWLDVQLFESGPLWNKVSDGVLLRQLAALDIRPDTTVVLAGRMLVANARVAHLLLYAGVRDVRLLDGGSAAWEQAGLPLTQNAPKAPEPVASFGLDTPACPHFLVDTAQVRALQQRPDATLVSIRTWSEFVGRTSGYDYIAARGEIAGARWGHAGSEGDVNDMSAFHTPAGVMLGAAEITALWHSQGIEAAGTVVFYCGTGWRASLAFFYAWLMGWEHIAVYDGGWMEWSSDAANPSTNRQLRVAQTGFDTGPHATA
ncbi:sulfurtransferase [Hydrogenophaga sp.]|uniref:sulfurtransferase n=1 Tax=Hydrogenophaga sp. TaxID=1904254 RepID=UPI003562EEBF